MSEAPPSASAGRDLEIAAKDGRRLAATLFMPSDPNGIAVQVNSATGVPRQYYRAFADYLAGRGFAVLTYDYRGIGDSRIAGPLRRQPSGAFDWAEQDQVGATEFLRAHMPGRRLVVVGHSFGGQILGLSPYAGEIAAALLVASPHGYWKHWTPGNRWRVAFLWYVAVPLLVPVLGYFPGRYFGMTDLPGGFTREWARWCRSPHYVSDRRGAPLRPFNDRMRAPVRQISFADDPIVPEAAARALLDYYPNAERRHDRFTPDHFGLERIGHFGFFRREMPIMAWADAADWLAAHAGL